MQNHCTTVEGSAQGPISCNLSQKPYVCKETDPSPSHKRFLQHNGKKEQLRWSAKSQFTPTYLHQQLNSLHSDFTKPVSHNRTNFQCCWAPTILVEINRKTGAHHFMRARVVRGKTLSIMEKGIWPEVQWSLWKTSKGFIWLCISIVRKLGIFPRKCTPFLSLFTCLCCFVFAALFLCWTLSDVLFFCLVLIWSCNLRSSESLE